MGAPGHDAGHAGRVDPGRKPAEVAVAEEGGGVEEEGGEAGQVEEWVLLDRGDDFVGEVQLASSSSCSSLTRALALTDLMALRATER